MSKEKRLDQIDTESRLKERQFLSLDDIEEERQNVIRQVYQVNYVKNFVEKLQERLLQNKDQLRLNQVRSLEKLIRFLGAGKLQGLIKQPMGAGKSRLSAEILASLKETSLVLVPRLNLLNATKKELVGDESSGIPGAGYTDEQVHCLDLQTLNGNAMQELKRVAECLREQPQNTEDLKNVIVMTYQSFLSIAKSAPALLDDFMLDVQVVISDEAHRSLGEGTAKALGKYDEQFEEELDPEEEKVEHQEKFEEWEEQKIEEYFREKCPKLHIRMTATPKLTEKTVQDIYDLEVIDWVRVQELVEDGTLILPQLPNIGLASCELDERVTLTQGLLGKLAELERFRMQDGRTVSEAVTTKYLELKEKHDGYLPSVAFCGTIEHAERYKHYLESLGIKAVRCTSSNEKYDVGMEPDKAQELLNNNEVDIVVTVSKVGEGWDVPTLRGALWLTPVRSPARILQGNGRIMRTLNEKMTERFPAKSRENTYVIEPLWELRAYGIGFGPRFNPEDGGPFKNKKRRRHEIFSRGEYGKYETKNFFEHLIEMDEYQREDLKKIDEGVRLREPINLRDHDQLRELIGSIHNLVKNGRGINLMDAPRFENKEKGWSISGFQIVSAVFRDQRANSTNAEKLAWLLWPEEADSLLSEEKFDINKEDHLRKIIGNIGNLIKDGKGKSLVEQSFVLPSKKWKVSGSQLGRVFFDNKAPSSYHSELLAWRLWPEKAIEVLPEKRFDIHNDDHLRQVIGDIKNLIQGGKGVPLKVKRFCLGEKKWNISGSQLGRALWQTDNPTANHAELLARRLWPEKAKELLPEEKFDIYNDDHLREIIGGIENLLCKGKGKRLLPKKFTLREKKWSVSGRQIGYALWQVEQPTIHHAELLAKRLWPEKAKELLPEQKLNLQNDNDFREIIGSISELIQKGKGCYLANKRFTLSEKKWSVSGHQIGIALWGVKTPSSIHAELLARRLWPEEATKLLGEVD